MSIQHPLGEDNSCDSRTPEIPGSKPGEGLAYAEQTASAGCPASGGHTNDAIAPSSVTGRAALSTGRAALSTLGTDLTIAIQELSKEAPDLASEISREFLGRSVPDVPNDCPTTALRGFNVRGVLRIGRMKSPRETFKVLEHPNLFELLSAAPSCDEAVIEAEKGAEWTVLDVDSHGHAKLPTTEELLAYESEIHPLPDASWISHGMGLKLVFVGPFHRDRALAAAASVPSLFTVELLTHTRHPKSTHSDRPGARCGPVSFHETDPSAEFTFRTVGRLSPKLQQQALDELGVSLGRRYDHDRCLIAPHDETTAQQCVVVLDGGIFCHRCAGHGVRHRQHLKPGFVPYSFLVGNEDTVLTELTKDLVHWTHAKQVLAHHHGNLGPKLQEETYRRSLEVHYGKDDPRIPQIFNPSLGFVRGRDVWLDAKYLKPTTVDNDAAGGMPFCQTVEVTKGEKNIKVDCVRRSQLKFREVPGYIPVIPYRGITFCQNPGGIPVQALPHAKYTITLLNKPMPEEEAFSKLEVAFPTLDRIYFKACLTAGICADARGGRPGMLCATGPSGSGKGETIRLAASCLGEDAVKVQLAENPEEFMRNIGMLLAAGHRYLVFDEFGKIRNLAQKVDLILQLGAVVSWRPLYSNNRVQSPCRAAFFFPCVRFPDFLCDSAEFVRRTRHVRLHRKTPDWEITSGGDSAAWRDRTEENAFVANSLLTHSWRTAHAHDFKFQ